MPVYTIIYKPSAAKAFRKIHPSEWKRIKDAVEGLATNPRPQGFIQLAGGTGECRIHVGQYRIVYDIEEDELVILILSLGHRREVYR